MYTNDDQLIFEQYQQINEISNVFGTGQDYSMWDRLKSEFGSSKLGKSLGLFKGAQGRMAVERAANDLIRRFQEMSGKRGQNEQQVFADTNLMQRWINDQIPQIVHDARVGSDFDVSTLPSFLTYKSNPSGLKPYALLKSVINDTYQKMHSGDQQPARELEEPEEQQTHQQQIEAQQREQARLKTELMRKQLEKTPTKKSTLSTSTTQSKPPTASSVINKPPVITQTPKKEKQQAKADTSSDVETSKTATPSDGGIQPLKFNKPIDSTAPIFARLVRGFKGDHETTKSALRAIGAFEDGQVTNPKFINNLDKEDINPTVLKKSLEELSVIGDTDKEQLLDLFKSKGLIESAQLDLKTHQFDFINCRTF